MIYPKFFRRKAAASYVRENWGYPCSPGTLAKLAVIGGGPIFRKGGRFPLYLPEDLDRWMQSKIGRPQKSTSDVPFDRAETCHD
jgi:hypothetical protein